MEEKRKRLNVEIPESLHWELKKWATIRNMYMGEYVQLILQEQIIKENKFI